jgi:hypothetical protein
MVSTPRWGGLRPEPYDPDAIDADNDGIVQEGTAWERPAGTRLLDELGREIIKGRTSTTPLTGLQYRDRNGKVVEYTPKTPSLPTGSRTPLARAGSPSLRERGMPTILDIQKQVHEARIGRLYVPSDRESINAGLNPPANEDLTQMLDRLTEEGINRRRSEREQRRLLRRREKYPRQEAPTSAGQAEPNAFAQTSTGQKIARHRARLDQQTKEVEQVFGELNTTKDARRALETAFPNLALSGRRNSTTDSLPSWATQPGSSKLEPHEKAYLVALLSGAIDDPTTASAMLTFSEDVGKAAGGYFNIGIKSLPNGEQRWGYLIALRPTRVKAKSLIKSVEEDKKFPIDQRTVPQTLYTLVDAHKAGQITDEELGTLAAHHFAVHEYGHATHLNKMLEDRGINMINAAARPPSDRFYRQIAEGFSSAFSRQISQDGNLSPEDIKAITDFYLKEGLMEIAGATSPYDSLSLEESRIAKNQMRDLSPYARVSSYEEVAELIASVKTGVVEIENLSPEVVRMLFWLGVIKTKSARLFLAFTKVSQRRNSLPDLRSQARENSICTGIIHLDD